MTTPPNSEGQIHPALLVAAQEAGIAEIYRLQGATAIAAMAYGMPTINKVDLNRRLWRVRSRASQALCTRNCRY